MSILCGMAYWYAAWSYRNTDSNLSMMHIVSGTITMSMIPFTWIFILGVNTKLFRAIGDQTTSQVVNIDRIRGLVQRWRWLNVVRAMFPLTGAIVGMVAVYGVVE